MLVRCKDSSPGDLWTWKPNPKLETRSNEGVVRAAAVFSFMETYLKILTKHQGKGALVDFRLNFVQEQLAQFVAWCWSRGLPVMCVIPKFRQGGVTTFWQALNFTLAYMDWSEGHRAATVSHDDDSSRLIFSISHRFLQHLPEDLRAAKPLTSRQEAQLVWESGSSIWVGTARSGDALGKGTTLNALHVSEAANWSDRGADANEAFVSIMNSVAQNEHTIVALESTAKGRDGFFFPFCENARAGKNDYTLFFFPWYLDPGYRMTWYQFRTTCIQRGVEDPGEAFVPSPEELDLRRRVLEQDKSKTPGSITWAWPRKLTDEQLIWRRWTITNKCQGEVGRFERYYPAFYDEAFKAQEDSFVSRDVIQHYYTQCRDAQRTTITFDSETGESCAVPDQDGVVSMFQAPIRGEHYVLGADVASGQGGDYSAAAIVRVKGMELVASVLSSKIEWDDYAALLYKLGRHYNDALLVVERNYNPAVVAELLNTHEYPHQRLYHYQDETALRLRLGGKAGWQTNRRTRALLLDRLKTALRDKKLVSFERELPYELESFVWNTRRRTYTAGPGRHDDFVMALGMAVAVIDPSDVAETEEKVTLHVENPARVAYEQYLERERQRQADRGPRGVVLL